MGYMIGADMALLHPPKTAGLWARSACAAVGLPWTRFGGCQHSDVAAPVDVVTMMFVRHPAKWLKSFWMYHQRTNWVQYTDSPGFIFYANYRPGEPFSVFVSRYLDRMPGAIGRMFERYERNADRVGHVESIVDDLIEFLGDYHPEIDASVIATLERKNASPAPQRLSVNFAHGQRDAVCKAEREFMSKWGYR